MKQILLIGVAGMLMYIFFVSEKVPAQDSVIELSSSASITFGSTEYDLLVQKYNDLVITGTPRLAIAALVDDSVADPAVLAICHDLLHEIGYTTYMHINDFGEAVTHHSNFCNSGYIHGIFEAYFSETNDPMTQVVEQCVRYTELTGRAFDVWQCYHGVGHGIMYFTDGALDHSFELCGGLPTEAAEDSCINGAYMEIFNSEVLVGEEGVVDPNNVFATCRERAVAKNHCYFYVPTYLYQTLSMSFADMFAACQGAGDSYAQTCIQGIGAEAMKRNMHDPNAVFNICTSFGNLDEERNACVYGAVSIHANQEGTIKNSGALCDIVEYAYRNACLKALDDKQILFQRVI